ncbi:hypothetical protein A11A3_02052 [Alcanivorax hongdengensis A-11-3]|uniref:Right handed beta helix domain-containing protein n=1 Tax=Alcanivorax hongdengensis A-11-3 TaxID=1177179 RepID=L0WFI0_9GAMM|nr:hypothetical protein [Alcanivorax hongdengensis]EKF75613.1 hypothetical protein A11A3_02052 [Alcanivorax hongdengensis A-11-3]
MNDVASSPRAELVELLWQLKQSFDQQGDSSLRFIHFNTLLNDPEYRAEIIARAAKSPNRKIRELGEKLQLANRDGGLLRKAAREPGLPGSNPALMNPDIAETIGTRSSQHLGEQRRRYRWLWLVAALVIAVGGYFSYHPARQMLVGEQVVSGSLFGKQHWGANTTWILNGIVYLEAGAELTIDPGTRIEGRPGSALVVTRDATLFSRGQAQAPIVFTSNQPAGTRTAGDWGGVVLLGNAPVNVNNGQIEGVPAGDNRGAFGGNDPDSSCGVMEFTRIEFAGFEVYADNELNGLTLGGCGSGTIIRNVQVHRALDDGIEIFGGDVDLRNIVITGAGDDSLDWDMGWRGRVQFLVAEQYANVGDNGFEGDNLKGSPDALPLSEPTMYNVTLLSPRSHEKYHRAMTLRRGTGGHFHNLLIEGFSGETIDIKDTATVARIDEGKLSFGSMMVHKVGSRGLTFFDNESMDQDDDGGFDERLYFQSSAVKAQFGTDPQFTRDATSMAHPDFAPSANSPARNGAAAIPQGEFWDEAANYLGAIRPGSVTSWVDGWTDFPLN